MLDKAKTPAPAFESDADEFETNFDTPTNPAPSVTPVTQVPAVVKPTAVGFNMVDNPISKLKDAIPVEYNTLSQLQAQQGNFFEKETKTPMGDWMIAEVMSWQDNWVVSPADEKAPKEIVKYSNDGVNCTDGTLVSDALMDLRRAGWVKAKLAQRATLVLAVMDCAKDKDKFVGTLMQCDLAPTSRTQWQRFSANTAFGLKLNKFRAEQVTKVRLSTRVSLNGTNAYTVIDFAVAP